MEKIHVVTVGGGGGHAQVLKALKVIPGIQITGVCPSTDSGGSTGILRAEYGANGYLGDLTKCVAALCPDPLLARTLTHRFSNGSLSGHSVKNILLLALEKEGGHAQALQLFWKLCGLGGHRVLPVTKQRTRLCATLRMGNAIVSETNIDTLAKNPLWHPDMHAIKSIYLSPRAIVSGPVSVAFKQARWIVICPGDFYSSIVPVLLPDGIKRAISDSQAQIVLVLNIVNKKGETDNYSANDFVQKVEKLLGKKMGVIFCNDKEVPKKVRARYALEEKVLFASTKSARDNRIIYLPFAEVADDGTLVHSLPVLTRAFTKMLV